jgi:hypothetical protein
MSAKLIRVYGLWDAIECELRRGSTNQRPGMRKKGINQVWKCQKKKNPVYKNQGHEPIHQKATWYMI